MTRFLNQVRGIFKRDGNYAKVTLSEEEIKKGAYKQHLGGGEEQWERRGAFQLFFLKEMGLQPSHQMFDIGCGPIRGGRYLIRYLNAGNYHGVDYNKDFVQVAKDLAAQDPELASKKPEIRHVQNFDFSFLKIHFDYVLLFSVLNHNSPELKEAFFLALPKVLKKTSKVYITHAGWFTCSMLSKSPSLRFIRSISQASDILPGLRMEDWGWPANESIFPILELSLSSDSS